MSATSESPALLRRILQAAPPVSRPGERCEMCGEQIGAVHSHVAQLEARTLMCSCRGCYLLFTSAGAAGGRYQAVPEDCLVDPAFSLSDADWDSLQIPVSMAFFFRSSGQERLSAFYPSPGGATESELALHAWDGLLAAAGGLPQPLADVQALLVRRADGRFRCYLVPIDLCYELVGLVRVHWRGFDGGADAHAEIDAFFQRLDERARVRTPGGETPS